MEVRTDRLGFDNLMQGASSKNIFMLNQMLFLFSGVINPLDLHGLIDIDMDVECGC